MLMLSKENIQNVFTMKEAIEAVKEALGIYSARKSVVPLRVNMDIPKEQGQCLFMPAYVDELKVIGLKIVAVFPKNIERGKPAVPAQMILVDGKTGETSAIINGTYLTRLRTGALQGVATDILAREDAKIAVLFGTGGQARTQLEAMISVRNLEEIRVIGTNFKRAQLFAKAMQEEFSQANTRIIAFEDGNQAIKDADIITTVTTSKTPVFDGGLIKKGVHINGIGSYMPEMQEISETVVRQADKIFFDTEEGVLAEAGDIIVPMKNGLVARDDFTGELGEVILGQVKGRETKQEITFFKSVGSAVFDVVIAQKIYTKALELNIGQRIEI